MPPAALHPAPEPLKVAGGYGEASIASGSFASSTGTALNLVVYWSVQDNGGQKVLKVTVSSSSYSLYCTGSACGVELVVNGMSYASGTPAIEYGGNSPVTNQLASFSIPNLSGPVSITAIWHFNGTYSGVYPRLRHCCRLSQSESSAGTTVN